MRKEFRTSSLALCPFLEMNGLNFLRAEPAIGKNDKPVVEFVFEDKLSQGPDLEQLYYKSEFHEYRRRIFFYRNEIERMRRRLLFIHKQESEKYDEKYYAGE